MDFSEGLSEKHQEQSIKVEDIRFFGDPEGKPTPDEVEKIDLSIDGELHLLRHFSTLSPAVMERLIGKKILNPDQTERTIDEEYIQNQLKTAGAKFSQGQSNLDDPEKLLVIAKKLIQEHLGELTWLRKGKQKRFILRVELTPDLKRTLGLDPEEPLGFGNLVEIDEELKDKIYKKNRGQNEATDQITRNFVKIENVPTTDGLVLVIQKLDDQENPYLFSMHPGLLTPSFPNRMFQSEEEFEYNHSFWSKHAFIES